MRPVFLAILFFIVGIRVGRISTQIRRVPVIDMDSKSEKTAYVARRMSEFLDEKMKPYCETFGVEEANVRLILIDEMVCGDARITSDFKELTSGEIHKALAD